MKDLTKKDYRNIDSINFSYALSAYNSESYIQYEETEFWLDSPKQKNIETDIVKKSIFRSLSDEAQEVIRIVLDCPQELLDFAITPKKKHWSDVGVRKYINEKFGKRKAKGVLNEIHRFLME